MKDKEKVEEIIRQTYVREKFRPIYEVGSKDLWGVIFRNLYGYGTIRIIKGAKHPRKQDPFLIRQRESGVYHVEGLWAGNMWIKEEGFLRKLLGKPPMPLEEKVSIHLHDSSHVFDEKVDPYEKVLPIYNSELE